MSDETTVTEESAEGEGKGLRAQLERALAESKTLREENAKFQAAYRATTVAEILKAKGVPATAAKLYNGDDVSEDAVGKWLEDYADVFNIRSSAATDENDANAQAAARVANASHGDVEGGRQASGAIVGDPAEMARLMTSLPVDELVKLGLMPKPGYLGVKNIK